ncbi:MAG: TetR/AcrR family transcriptional regulator [Sakamotonia sp.]|jgi:AcrR family transcriptional regulator
MPKVAYSEEDRQRIRSELVKTGLDLMSRQGIQHTTVEQIYKKVGISRTFFYSFFPAKEDLIVEMLYLQQPRILEYAKRLMEDPDLSWREGVRQFLWDCCYGEQKGIAVLTIEEQQQIFKRLSEENCRLFRERQHRLFGQILECFGIASNTERIGLFINLSLTAMVIRRAVPHTLPFFVPEAMDETITFQIEAIADALEAMKNSGLQ